MSQKIVWLAREVMWIPDVSPLRFATEMTPFMGTGEDPLVGCR